MGVVFVEVEAAAGALADLAERQLAQASDLVQQGRAGTGSSARRICLPSAVMPSSSVAATAAASRAGGSGDATGASNRRREPSRRPSAYSALRTLRNAVAASRFVDPHRLPDAQRQRPAAARVHLARQQGRRRWFEQRRGAIEQRRIARLDPYRQHRRRCLAREAQEAALPAAIAHAAQAQPRHFAGREHDHALLVVERAIDGAQVLGTRPCRRGCAPAAAGPTAARSSTACRWRRCVTSRRTCATQCSSASASSAPEGWLATISSRPRAGMRAWSAASTW